MNSDLPALIRDLAARRMLPRAGWVACDRPARLTTTFAFGRYDGPVRVLATHAGDGRACVEYDQPGRGPTVAVCTLDALSEPEDER